MAEFAMQRPTWRWDWRYVRKIGRYPRSRPDRYAVLMDRSEIGTGIDFFRNGECLVACGRCLAQIVCDVDRLADSHQHGRVGDADLADCGAARMDTDGDFYFVVRSPPEPIVKVCNHALDCTGRLQSPLRGIVLAFMAKQ